MTGAARRHPGRAAVMVLVTLVLVALGSLTAAPQASAELAQTCGLPGLPDCETDPTGPDPTSTSTTLLRTTTTTRATTSTTARTTATTAARATTTTTAPGATTTTISVTTSSNLLVPGDGTKGAESTTTTVATAAKVKDGGLSDGTLIALVIAGLVVIAGVVAVLTWRYWAATRPPLVDTQAPRAR